MNPSMIIYHFTCPSCNKESKSLSIISSNKNKDTNFRCTKCKKEVCVKKYTTEHASFRIHDDSDKAQSIRRNLENQINQSAKPGRLWEIFGLIGLIAAIIIYFARSF